MQHETMTRLSLKALAKALEKDVQELGKVAAGGERKDNPWANVMSAVGDIKDQLKAIEKASIEQRDRHLGERAKLLRVSIEDERNQLDDAIALRSEEVTKVVEGRFVVAGRVVDVKSGVGLPEAQVHLVHAATGKPTVVAKSTTDDLGFYRHELGASKDVPGAAAAPEIEVQILDARGKVVHRVDSRIAPAPDKVADVDVGLDAALLPGSLARGQRYASRVAARRQDTARDARALSSREALRGGLLRPAKPVEPPLGRTSPTRPTSPTEPKTPSTPTKPTTPTRPTTQTTPTQLSKPTTPGLEEAPPEHSGQDVTAIKGIGPVLAARLEEKEITDAAGVAALSPTSLAEILDISEARASRIRAAALLAARG